MKDEFLLNEISAALREKGIGLDIITDYQEKASLLFSEENKQGLVKLLSDIKEKYLEVDLSDLFEYVHLLDFEGKNILKKSSIKKETQVSAPVLNALSNYFNDEERQKIIKINKNYNYSEVKQISKSIMNVFMDRKSNDVNNYVFPFLISKERKIKGLIVSKINENSSIPLIEITPPSEDKDMNIKFFGEKFIKYRTSESYDELFYIYKFKSRYENYVLLSLKELPLQFCEVEGMVVNIKDENKIGEKAVLPKNLKVIFVYNVKEDNTKIEKEQFKEITKEWNHEKMAEMVFGSFRHPAWFEKFILSWLLSGKFTRFPLHIGIIAKAGTGKSAMIEAIHKQMQEIETIYDGSTSTLKGLVPSYGRNKADEGYFCRCRRVSFVDEFLTLLTRSMNGKTMAQNDETGLLTSLLEHKKRTAGSGQTNNIEVNPTAKLILVTNEKKKILPSLSTMAEKLNNPFLSRVLWYVQTKQHIEFIQERQQIVDALKDPYPKINKDFLSVYDYLNEISLSPNPKDIKNIFLRTKEFVPAELEEVYNARSKHHIACLIDGIAKYNSIIEKREELIITKKDVEEAEELFITLILSWNIDDVDFHRMPIRTRKEHITLKERKIYDIVEKDFGQNGLAIATLAGIPQPTTHRILKKLQTLELIDEMGEDGWFPFWHSRVKNKKSGVEIKEEGVDNK